jgi:Lrp/AsnC family transcriptional regulator for asnA, asnC and gidA
MAGLLESSLDLLDLQILKHLTKDGRRSFQEIADDLGVSYGTVRNRYLKMCENNRLRIVGWMEPAQVGLHAFANVRITVDAPFLEQVALRIAQFPEVNWLARVIGEFDLAAEVSCRDIDHLNDLIDQQINKMEGVRQTRVALYTKTYKVITLPNIEMAERLLRNEGVKIGA